MIINAPHTLDWLGALQTGRLYLPDFLSFLSVELFIWVHGATHSLCKIRSLEYLSSQSSCMWLSSSTSVTSVWWIICESVFLVWVWKSSKPTGIQSQTSQLTFRSWLPFHLSKYVLCFQIFYLLCFLLFYLKPVFFSPFFSLWCDCSFHPAHYLILLLDNCCGYGHCLTDHHSFERLCASPQLL